MPEQSTVKSTTTSFHIRKSYKAEKTNNQYIHNTGASGNYNNCNIVMGRHRNRDERQETDTENKNNMDDQGHSCQNDNAIPEWAETLKKDIIHSLAKELDKMMDKATERLYTEINNKIQSAMDAVLSDYENLKQTVQKLEDNLLIMYFILANMASDLNSPQ